MKGLGVRVGYKFEEEKVKRDETHSKLFTAFREMYRVRDFQLVLCADTHVRAQRYSMDLLNSVVEEKRKEEEFASSLSKVSVIFDRRSPRIRYWGSTHIDVL